MTPCIQAPCDGDGVKCNRLNQVLMGLHLGTNLATDDEVIVNESDVDMLRLHVALLGTTGSGKTVAAKVLLEEAALAGVPSIVVDPQGDLGRLAILGASDALVHAGGDVERQQRYNETVEVRIWTPTKSYGLPLCIDPFSANPTTIHPANEEEEQLFIAAVDIMASGFTALAGFSGDRREDRVKAFLNELFTYAVQSEAMPENFVDLANLIADPSVSFERWGRLDVLEGLLDGFLKKSEIEELSRRIRTLSTGVNRLMFSSGVPLDIEMLRTPMTEGCTPINVIHMKALGDEAAQQNFLLEMSRAIYTWMLQNGTDGALKLVFFMDEVKPYLPPHPQNPPAKATVSLLYKQGRKYGVSCIFATQNLKDVDYKIFSQANTVLLGKVKGVRELEIVEKLLPSKEHAERLRQFSAGEFLLCNERFSPHPVHMKTRWLYSEHGPPLNDDDVRALVPDLLRAWASERSVRSTSPPTPRSTSSHGGASTAHKQEVEGDGAEHVPPSSEGSDGMALEPVDDGAGLVTIINESPSLVRAYVEHDKDASPAFHIVNGEEGRTSVKLRERHQVNLMGGLSILSDSTDPLHVMLSLTNLLTMLTFLVVDLMFFEAWRNGDMGLLLPFVGLMVAFLCIGIFVAESLLHDEHSLARHVRAKAQPLQYLVLAWAWMLWLAPLTLPSLDYPPWELALVLAAQTSTTILILADLGHRFQLRRLDESINDAGQSLSTSLRHKVLGAAQLNDLVTSSERLLRNVRLVTDVLVVYLLLVVLDLLPTMLKADVDVLAMRVVSMVAINAFTEVVVRSRTSWRRPGVDIS